MWSYVACCANEYVKENYMTILAIYHGTYITCDYGQLGTEQYTYVTKC